MAADPKQGKEQTLGLIKPNAYSKRADIIGLIKKDGFTIAEQKEVTLTRNQVENFYAEHRGKKFYDELCTFMTSGPTIALLLEKADAIKEWRRVMGPTSVETAKKEAPNSIRALYGENVTKNAAHGSDSPESAKREVGFFFHVEDTYAMIKPNAVSHKDAIIAEIKKEGFDVVKFKEIRLTKLQAEEFYAEHKGKKFFDELVGFMTGGDVVCLHLRAPNAIQAWRYLMGPTNPNTAKQDYPLCLRARYATGFTENATHGSDSPISAARELELAFGPKGFAAQK
ncbi:hypothetical protein RFI_12103 [Reticulomyxa filosa]|uniref:Nucleoside diphosphate kinase n=1 Tax=Reticulomyxa filosa TaxID=46433 RepID=X6NFE7_RETFI|nr:hypothetical protein RFI_12103 [Reticulomyxa filosa]|eukprot:ETO25040.1 hypothetical protein RFI_12103 [Reticulomyxa filosa]